MRAVYYRQMVDLGKTHKQAGGVVMNRLLSRVYTVLKEERPHQLRDLGGNQVTMVEARSLVREDSRFRKRCAGYAAITTASRKGTSHRRSPPS
jgi:hypothetical protein